MNCRTHLNVCHSLYHMKYNESSRVQYCNMFNNANTFSFSILMSQVTFTQNYTKITTLYIIDNRGVISLTIPTYVVIPLVIPRLLDPSSIMGWKEVTPKALKGLLSVITLVYVRLSVIVFDVFKLFLEFFLFDFVLTISHPIRPTNIIFGM